MEFKIKLKFKFSDIGGIPTTAMTVYNHDANAFWINAIAIRSNNWKTYIFDTSEPEDVGMTIEGTDNISFYVTNPKLVRTFEEKTGIEDYVMLDETEETVSKSIQEIKEFVLELNDGNRFMCHKYAKAIECELTITKKNGDEVTRFYSEKDSDDAVVWCL